MPLRKEHIFTGQIYHVYNRGIADEPTFRHFRDYSRFIETINYYRFSSLELRFSYFQRLSKTQQLLFLENMEKFKDKQVEIFAFCLMPNHFHFLLKELLDFGIKNFISCLQESYAKYLNIKTKRKGSLFIEMFKAVRIESDEQFIHTARYIHLNPSTSYLTRDIQELKNYPWSSFKSYLGNNDFHFVETGLLNSFYQSREKLMSFTFNQIDYQRKLLENRHLTLDY